MFFFIAGSHLKFDVIVNLFNGSKPIRVSGFMMYFAAKYVSYKVNTSATSSKLYLFNQTLGINNVIQLGQIFVLSDLFKELWPCFDCDLSRANIFMSAIPSRFVEMAQTYFYTLERPVINFYPSPFNSISTIRNVGTTRLLNSGSDKPRLNVLLDLMAQLRFSYLSLITSDIIEIELVSNHFRSSFNGCIEDDYVLPDEPIWDVSAGLLEHFKRLNSLSHLSVIVLFTDDNHSRIVLEVLKILNLNKRFILIFVFGSSSRIDVIQGLEETAQGSLAIEYLVEENLDFKEYVFQQNPNNNMDDENFLLYYEEIFQCNLGVNISLTNRQVFNKTCMQPYLNLSAENGYYYSPFPQFAIGAMYNFFQTLHDVMANYGCNESQSECPNFFFYQRMILAPNKIYELLSNALEKNFNAKNVPGVNSTYAIYNLQPVSSATTISYENRIVGVWMLSERHKFKLNDLFFGRGKQASNGHCSLPCQPGYFQQHVNASSIKSCCWECVKCPLKHVIINNQCVPCSSTETANLITNKCDLLPQVLFSIKGGWKEPIIISFSLLGIMIATCLVVLHVKYSKNEIIKASGLELSLAILIGVIILFSCPFYFFANPSALVCITRNMIPPFACMYIYGALLLKIVRVYRIFTKTKQTTILPFISKESQISTLMAFSVFQLSYTSLRYIGGIPVPDLILSDDGSYVTVICKNAHNPMSILVDNIPLFLTLLITNIFGILCRDFDQHFHEAYYVAVTSYLTTVIWTVFYFGLVYSKSNAEYLISALCILLGYASMLVLFYRRVVLLYQG